MEKMHMKILRNILIGTFLVFIAVFASSYIFAGKLYIKPELELRRAERLVETADADYRNAKIHMLLSPEIAVKEFEQAWGKYKDAIEIIEKYGQ